ncbi:hypothetical protein ACJJIP_06365 [Microbulbifer sp. VTAC004]|uniref:hypothetical protein n=1 Tax=unclassified Microbulbifer TaxID=2619833 RepID=UPI00403914EE
MSNKTPNALTLNEPRITIPAQPPKNYSELQTDEKRRQQMAGLCSDIVDSLCEPQRVSEAPSNFIEVKGG